MGFQHESTLAGYARAATDDRIRMTEYASGPWFPEHVRNWYEVRFVQDGRRVFRDASLADFARLTTRGVAGRSAERRRARDDRDPVSSSLSR